MELLRGFMVCVLLFAGMNIFAAVVVKQENKQWKITGENYSAIIGEAGYLRSIKVKGKEFLSRSKKFLAVHTYVIKRELKSHVS